MQEKKKLIALGAELYRLGIEIDASKRRLKKLVEIGMPYDSDEVTSAVLRLQFLQAHSMLFLPALTLIQLKHASDTRLLACLVQ